MSEDVIILFYIILGKEEVLFLRLCLKFSQDTFLRHAVSRERNSHLSLLTRNSPPNLIFDQYFSSVLCLGLPNSLHALAYCIYLLFLFKILVILFVFLSLMGSTNSEHSGSMDSDEFSNFIGHNYGQSMPHWLAAPHFEVDVNSLSMKDVMVHPWSPTTRNRIHEEAQIFVNGGIVCNDSRPSHTDTNSTRASNSTSPVEFNYGSTDLPQFFVGNFSPHSTPVIPASIINPTASLEHLQHNFCVNNGILSLSNFEHGETSKTQNNVTWNNIVTRNVNSPQASSNVESNMTYNEDGSASLNLSREFLINAQKQWATSLIGHFFGGVLLSNLFANRLLSFGRVGDCLESILVLKVLYIPIQYLRRKECSPEYKLRSDGGKCLFLLPWMEGSKFKRNVITKIPCWIRLVNFPY